MMYAQYMKQYGRALKIAQKLYQEKANPEMEMTALKVRKTFILKEFYG